MAKDTTLIEMAGVHYVSYQLSAHRCTVALLPDRTSIFDLVALNTESGKSCPVQVKAATNAMRYSRSGNFRAWTAGSKMFEVTVEGPAFVVLVDLCGGPLEPNGPCQSIAYVIPWGKWEEDENLRYQPARGNWLNIVPGQHDTNFLERWDRIKEAIQ